MTGRRVRVPEDAYPSDVSLEPGDYAWLAKVSHWMVRAPNGDVGCISPKIHEITEHEDGTITVSPSIQFLTGKQWHGYLGRGVWRQV